MCMCVVCACAYVSVCIHLCGVCERVFTCVLYVSIYVCICVCICMCICVCEVYMSVCMCYVCEVGVR